MMSSSLQVAISNVKSQSGTVTAENTFESNFSQGLDFSEFGTGCNKDDGKVVSASQLMLQQKEKEARLALEEEEAEATLMSKVASRKLSEKTNKTLALFETSFSIGHKKKKLPEDISLSDALTQMHGGDMNGGAKERGEAFKKRHICKKKNPKVIKARKRFAKGSIKSKNLRK